MDLKINVLSLNCWGIPTRLACKQRSERLDAIGKQLSKGEYDIVLLQEIWSQEDYEKLCSKVLTMMPHTHYWHSGMIGSGVCVFSKHYIQETFQHNYGVNGYAHKILHGDWYGGKCVGLAKIIKDDFRINVYATHLHAGYGNDGRYFRANYLPHRITQAYEMSQFIRFTSEACDAVIVAGDFNYSPDSLGYKMIKYNANLEDAWLAQKENKIHGSTANNQMNCFSDPHSTPNCIDYVMFRSNSGTSMKCDVCKLAMGKVPGEKYNYSDHEGVAAELRMRKKVTAVSSVRDFAQIEKTYSEVIPVLDTGIKQIQADQVFYMVGFLLCLLMLMFTSNLVLPWRLDPIVVLLRISVVLASGFFLWMGTVMANREISGLLSAKKDINNLLKSNPVT